MCIRDSFESYKALVEWQLEAGVDGLVVLGSTGEAATLDTDEKHALVKATKELVQGAVPIIVGTTSNCTYQALENTQAMAELGADIALIATPPYNRPTQKGLIEHFTVLAEQGGLPIMLYDIPGRTACKLEVETTKILAELSSIIAIKDASGVSGRTKELVSKVGSKIAVFSGEDHMAHECIELGGKGLVSASASGFPVEMAEIVHKGLAGDLAASKEAQEKVQSIIKTMFIETNPSPVKEALRQKSIIASSRVRLPLVGVSDATADLISKLV